MNIERTMRRFLCEAWYMPADQFSLMLQTAALAVATFGRETLVGAAGRVTSDDGKYMPLEKRVEMHSNNVAVVPVEGVIGLGWDDWEKRMGGMDVEELCCVLSDLAQAPKVKAIVLNINSPGGLVTGTPECAEHIAALAQVKPIFVWTNTMIASAAYFIAAGATAIYSSASALVGSIGVYLPLLDISGLYEKLGLKVELFKSGALKGAGYPGVALTDEQREHFQEHVQHAFTAFRDHVKAYRQHVEDDCMQGQCMWGDQAQAAGLVDSIACMEQAICDAGQYADLMAEH